jgi:hypothetical protein
MPNRILKGLNFDHSIFAFRSVEIRAPHLRSLRSSLPLSLPLQSIGTLLLLRPGRFDFSETALN